LFLLFYILWHRQIYKEDCFGESRFSFEEYGKIKNPKIGESSGLAFEKDSLFWTHNDDTDSALYLISASGKSVSKMHIPFRNRDWEDITKDKSGNLYVGEFGNNFQIEKKTKILKINLLTKIQTGEINFSYEDSEGKPSYFDCEAMVHWDNRLYLFTKNKNERSSLVFSIPDQPGTYQIKEKQSLPIYGMATGAALRPDGKELAILTYGKIYFYSLPRFLSGRIPLPDYCFAFRTMRQSESISYWGSDSLLIGNEQGNLYLMKRKL